MAHRAEDGFGAGCQDAPHTPVLAYRDESFEPEEREDRLFGLDPLISPIADDGERLLQILDESLSPDDPVSVCQRGFSDVIVKITTGLTIGVKPDRFVDDSRMNDLHAIAKDTFASVKEDCIARCIAGLACGECTFAKVPLTAEEFVEAVGANDTVNRDTTRQYDSTPVLAAFSDLMGFWVLPRTTYLNNMPKRTLQLVGAQLRKFASRRKEFIFTVQQSLDI